MRRETELRQTLSELPDKRKKKGDDSDVPYLFLLTDVGHVVDDTNNPASLRSGGVANIPGIGGQHRRNTQNALGLQRVLGLGSYQTAWTWLHKLRREMVRPDRDRLKGWIEVDETIVGGLEEG